MPDKPSPAEDRLGNLVAIDKAAREDAVVRPAIRAILDELEKPQPELSIVQENLPIILEQKGSDGVLVRNSGFPISVGQAIHARRNDEAAKSVIDYISQAVKHKIGGERRNHTALANLENKIYDGKTGRDR